MTDRKMPGDTREPIAFYFDIFSPFGYLASTQIETIAARHGRTVDWRPVLVGITVLKVMGMNPLPTYPLKGPYLSHDMDRFARLYDVPLKHHGLKGHNSLAAMRAFVWLKQQDPSMAIAFAKAMYARLWVAGKDITPPEACAEEARALGLDAGAMLDAIASDAVKQELTRQVNDAIDKGVFGVPFFIADGESFFGNDHIWMMEHWLEHGTWETSQPPDASP
ncbi:MAG: 2-hydroxychromene-2-carboxylate isomerase [Hyphomicrobiales bacterium]|nr:2-hydroxychromene-2-carboxylate isomerase [Hyphomicrobiales bacterium]